MLFTQPVDAKTAGDVASYSCKSWTYNYHAGYGDKPRNEATLTIKSATVGADGKSVRLEIEGLRPYYVHELRGEGVRNSDGNPLLHPDAYYTLNRIPK